MFGNMTLFTQTGMEFRDSAYLISAKNTRQLKKDMIVNLTLGFQDLEEDGKKWVLMLLIYTAC